MRICGGYERYPVFINRTSAGMAKRIALEEVKPDFSSSEPVPWSSVLDTSHNRRSKGLQLDQLSIFESPTPQAVSEVRFVAWFWDHYAPSTSESLQEKPAWLYQAININKPTLLLRNILLALSVTSYGRAHNDVAVAREGRRLYSKGIGSLQKALNHPQLMWHDETLVAVRAMILYELFDSTTEDTTPWHNHLEGVSHLLQVRGPQRHRNSLSRAVYEDLRYVLMIQSLMRRKMSPFGTTQWMQEPWVNDEKDFEQEIFDTGFRIAFLFDSGTSLKVLQDNKAILEGIIKILNESNDLNCRFAVLRVRLLEDQLSIREPNIDMMVLLLTIWALQLALAFMVGPLVCKLRRLGNVVPSPRTEHVQMLCSEAEGYSSITRRLDISHKIVQTAARCLDQGMGLFVANKAIFPLNVALEQLRGTDWGARCRMLLLQLTDQRGLRFAREVEQGKYPSQLNIAETAREA
jgi:hypothetical protein